MRRSARFEAKSSHRLRYAALENFADCIVAALREDPRAFLEGGVVAERIGVFWPHAGRWYLATSWAADTPEFAWADDCDLMVRDFA